MRMILMRQAQYLVQQLQVILVSLQTSLVKQQSLQQRFLVPQLLVTQHSLNELPEHLLM